jgi:beta-lactamase class A
LNVVLPVGLVLAALAVPAPDPAPDPLRDAVVAAATAAERASGAVVGVSVLHLESGRRASHRGGERFQMASVFKAPVAVAVLAAVERGQLTLDREVEVKASDRRAWGPINDHWTPGMRVTVGRMVDVMLVDSDNTACDLLIRLVGGPASVEKALVDRDVAGIRISLDEKGMDAAAKKNRAAFEGGAQNGASPDAMAAFLARLFKGELLSKSSTDRILDAMRRCATGERRLRAGLPKGTEIRDKTGTATSCANDAGIVTLPDGSHVVVAVFTRGGRDAAAREAAIASMAKAAWEALR